MNRVAFFVDGFNLYHSIKENAPDCRWLDLNKLCKSLISSTEEIVSIFYFTAIATWLPDQTKPQKHRKYIQRLEKEGVVPVLGKFKEKDIYCRYCQQKRKSHEEKQTDVNVALKIISEAVLDHYDTAVLVSGDTDMIPAILTLKQLFPQKRIGVVFPIGRKTLELENVADFSRKINRKQLIDSLFETDTAPDGWVPSAD